MAYSKKTEKDPSILDIKALGERIKTSSSDSLFLIYGEEDFFIEMSVASIKKKYLGEGAEAMDFVKLDFGGKELVVDDIASNTELPPWLSEKRIIHVANFQFPSETDNLVNIIKKVPDSSVLIFTCESFDKRKKSLYNAFKDNGVVAESAFLDESKLIAWISRAFSKNSITIDPNSALSIVNRCDKSMRLISSEVTKIILFCQGSNESVVTMEMVEDLCPPDINGSVFNITDSVGSGDVATALKILDNLIVQKEPPIKIRFMLMRHLKQLICAKDLGRKDDIVKRLKVQPFVADKLLRQSNRFSMDMLTKLYIECSRQDMEIKHGNLEPRQSLESFIVLSCGK